MISIDNPILYNIWKDRYCKNEETIEGNLHRVAHYLANNEDEEKEFFDVMANGYFFPAGRTMSNAGLGGHLGMSNCYVAPLMDDSMEGIFEQVKLGAITHKSGGGIGYQISNISPRGRETHNDAIASGAVSFLDVFNAQTATVEQGSRRGM